MFQSPLNLVRVQLFPSLPKHSLFLTVYPAFQVIVRRARCRLTCAAMDGRLAPTKIKLMEWSAVEWFEPLEWQQAGSEIPGYQDLLAQKAKVSFRGK